MAEAGKVNEPITFIFAAEIEDATVSILWHEPERLGGFLRELDPAVHLTQPALRYILEAITLVYRELGSSDFALVVEILRELYHFEEVGGIEGLNRIFSLKEIRADKDTTDAIFGEYVRLLQLYAEARQPNPPIQSAYRFSGGRGTLTRNKVKRHVTDCDFSGPLRVAGKDYQARAYVASDGEFLNFLCSPNP